MRGGGGVDGWVELRDVLGVDRWGGYTLWGESNSWAGVVGVAGAGPVRRGDVGPGAGADAVRDASAGAAEAGSGGSWGGGGGIAFQGVSGGGAVLGFHAARVPGVRAEEQGAGVDGRD